MRTTAISISLALFGACAVNHSEEPQPDDVGTCSSCSSNDQGSGSAGSGSGGGGAAACPLGVAAFTSVLGASDAQQQLSLAVDMSGDIMVGAEGQVSGFTELSASGVVLASLPFGSLVAVDRAGNTFIAGSFTAPIDLGKGTVLVPQGNIDVFVVELDVRGRVVLAKSLGLCGDGIEGLAVARDRRIAISGTAMGTVVLDRSGHVILQLAESGRLAFTSQGELAIAGIDANGQAAVMLVDRGGIAIFDQVFPASVTLTGVAIDATGDIVAVGNSEASFDLFGSEVIANYENQVRISGAFGVKFDPAGNAVLATQLFVAFANAVAIGADGLPYFAMTTRGFVGPEVEGSGLLGRIDNASSVTFFGVGQLFRGGYDALAVDACGSFILGGAGFQDPAVPTTNALVVKVSL